MVATVILRSWEVNHQSCWWHPLAQWMSDVPQERPSSAQGRPRQVLSKQLPTSPEEHMFLLHEDNCSTSVRNWTVVGCQEPATALCGRATEDSFLLGSEVHWTLFHRGWKSFVRERHFRHRIRYDQQVFWPYTEILSAVINARRQLHVHTRNTFCGTWYLPHSQVHNDWAVLIMVGWNKSNLVGDLSIVHVQRILRTELYSLWQVYVTDTGWCYSTLMSWKTRKFRRFGYK